VAFCTSTRPASTQISSAAGDAVRLHAFLLQQPTVS
jgi:hypothetical protein